MKGFGGDPKILTVERLIHNKKFYLIMILETMINSDKVKDNMAMWLCNLCFMAIGSLGKYGV